LLGRLRGLRVRGGGLHRDLLVEGGTVLPSPVLTSRGIGGLQSIVLNHPRSLAISRRARALSAGGDGPG
jgi:hypothetical protein